MAVAPPEDPKLVAPGHAAPPDAPAAPVGKPSRAGFFRRLTIGTNVTLQMLLLAFILLGINGYAFKHYHRFDFSRDGKYTLSERTKQLVGSLTKPVKIIVFMTAQSPIQVDVARLAEEYRIANPKFVSVEPIDPFRNAGRASEVQAKYKLAQQENVVILDYEGRTKIIRDDKMAELDTSGVQYNQPVKIAAFTGEQAISAGLLEITEGKKSVVYYVQGHGESAVGVGKPLEVLGKLLENEHVEVKDINLLNVPSVPADAGILMIFGAQLDYTDREVQSLDEYWNKGGRFLIQLDPNAPTPHLAGFLGRLGIKIDDDRVVVTQSIGNVVGLMRDVYAQIVGHTPLAQQLAGIEVPLVGSTQSLTLEPEKVSQAGVRLEPLLQALKGYWGETDYKDLENTGAYFDKGKDKEGDLVVGATVQKGAVTDRRVQTNSARMVVIANARCFAKGGFSEQSAVLFVGTLNWLLEREALIGIPPKLIQSTSLNLPQERIDQFFLVMVVGIPAACALLGFVVWWRRRA